MRLDCLPFPSAGKPLIVRTLGWLLIAISLVASSRVVFLLGIGLIIASQGRDVLVEDCLVLRYALLKVRIRGIDEVANLSEMDKGSLIKWSTGLLLEPIFLLLSLLVLLSGGARFSFILPVLVYWGVLYAEILLFPLKRLKKRLGMSVALPFIASLPFTFFQEGGVGLMPFLWLVGTLFLVNLLTRDGLVIRTGGEGYLLLCGDGERLMEVMLGVAQDG